MLQHGKFVRFGKICTIKFLFKAACSLLMLPSFSNKYITWEYKDQSPTEKWISLLEKIWRYTTNMGLFVAYLHYACKINVFSFWTNKICNLCSTSFSIFLALHHLLWHFIVKTLNQCHLSLVSSVRYCDSSTEGMVSFEIILKVKKKKKHCQKVKQPITVIGRRSNKSNR